MEKRLKGRAIYMPQHRAAEYAKYACNFYVGCSNDCDYCYCKRGVLGHAMGKPQATLKKCFKNEEHALQVFEKELRANLTELREHGLFFTFTSDPMIKECYQLTYEAVTMAAHYGVCCKILTKRADFRMAEEWYCEWYKNRIAFGFTLTGHDELERGASTNAERINCMRKLHEAGFRTFASIEPIIDLESSYAMIEQTLDCCDLYKIGLMSGKRNYTPEEVAGFVIKVNNMVQEQNFAYQDEVKTYWKESVLEFLKMDRENDRFSWRFNWPHCVGADYNMFNN